MVQPIKVRGVKGEPGKKETGGEKEEGEGCNQNGTPCDSWRIFGGEDSMSRAG